MGLLKPCLLLVLVLLIAQAPGLHGVQPLPPAQRFSKISATLGMSCKCCDGEEGICRSTWEASCSKLECLPWKFQ
ncbi:hypothetical protein ACHQM5_024470 [Ranunculus cassubicifolius]